MLAPWTPRSSPSSCSRPSCSRSPSPSPCRAAAQLDDIREQTEGRATGDDLAGRVRQLIEETDAAAFQLDGARRDLAYLIELIGIGIVRLDDDRRIELANAAAHAFLERPAGSLRGMGATGAFLDARIEAIVETARETGSASGEVRLRSGRPGPDGPGAALAGPRPVARPRGRLGAAPPPADPRRVHRQPLARAADAAHDGQPPRRDADPRGGRGRRGDPAQDARPDRQDRGRDRAPRPDGQRAARPLADRDRRAPRSSSTTSTWAGSPTATHRAASGCSPTARA